jgi:hypothetical protein
MRKALAVALLALMSGTALAGTIYEVTAKKGDEEVKYRVKFGGGKAAIVWTAFDPDTKKFVYLSFDRDKAQAPEPAATIFDHRTGETIKLYKFPNAKNPLPVIPKLDEMKVCPITGDTKFSANRIGNYD